VKYELYQKSEAVLAKYGFGKNTPCPCGARIYDVVWSGEITDTGW